MDRDRVVEAAVYELALETALQLFALSGGWPLEERNSLVEPIRRSSRAVCGSLAEAWRRRRHRPGFLAKLADCDAAAAETQVWLTFAHHCGYLDEEPYRALNTNYDIICRHLQAMMQGTCTSALSRATPVMVPAGGVQGASNREG